MAKEEGVAKEEGSGQGRGEWLRKRGVAKEEGRG